jgi:hypothetical protein
MLGILRSSGGRAAVGRVGTPTYCGLFAAVLRPFDKLRAGKAQRDLRGRLRVSQMGQTTTSAAHIIAFASVVNARSRRLSEETHPQGGWATKAVGASKPDIRNMGRRGRLLFTELNKRVLRSRFDPSAGSGQARLSVTWGRRRVTQMGQTRWRLFAAVLRQAQNDAAHRWDVPGK